MVHLSGEITNFWPYRSANICIVASIELDDFDYKIVKRFIERSGHRMDNHICWEVKGSIYMKYSDGKLSIGNKIIIGNW